MQPSCSWLQPQVKCCSVGDVAPSLTPEPLNPAYEGSYNHPEALNFSGENTPEPADYLTTFRYGMMAFTLLIASFSGSPLSSSGGVCRQSHRTVPLKPPDEHTGPGVGYEASPYVTCNNTPPDTGLTHSKGDRQEVGEYNHQEDLPYEGEDQ